MQHQDKLRHIAQVGMLLALIAILHLGLLAALVSGLLVYHMAEFGAARLERIGIIPNTGKGMVLIVVVCVFVALAVLAVMGLLAQMTHGPESIEALMQKMADVVDSARDRLPAWAQEALPKTVEEWRITSSQWLRSNAGHFSLWGKEFGIALAHIIIGMVVGGLVALDDRPVSDAPLAQLLYQRMLLLGRAFSNIVFSQVRISALNTALTAVFLLVVLPLSGNPLPLAKTMVIVTFLVGLLPIIGNLISNTMIFLVALSVSTFAAIAALLYLMFIHKLEYFINARIIGARINARAWEILGFMLVMEAAFGIPGLVAAPIYYAYLKEELIAEKMV